ncbi:hypothetical protein NQ176_g7829 [Zarea fungicola]|uniref:Uncharacterized protein n=1 Tax=Zarea fungicola TaxID=93591 RepID=A0ACC1MXC1_9HYPO|nr:hypothetical protein NQ176_g7829 [Lecanicillium fungicola]
MTSKYVIEKLSLQSVEPHQHASIRTTVDPWSRPLEGAQGWLEGLETIVPKLYVTYGGREVLGDHSRMLMTTLKKESPAVEIVSYEAPKELHDGILVEYLMRKPAVGAKKMKTWFKSIILP